jgi:tricarballylate dehydrogenase
MRRSVPRWRPEAQARRSGCSRSRHAPSEGAIPFTGGAMRVAFNGVADLVELMPDLTAAEQTRCRLRFLLRGRVLRRHGDGSPKTAPTRTSSRSWSPTASRRSSGCARTGFGFNPPTGARRSRSTGEFQFWGGLAVEVNGGGPGLIDQLVAAVERRGIDIQYETRAIELLFDGHAVHGVKVRCRGEASTFPPTRSYWHPGV